LLVEGLEDGGHIAFGHARRIGDACENFGLCRRFGSGFRHIAESSRLVQKLLETLQRASIRAL
jgi:hypothetical protein